MIGNVIFKELKTGAYFHVSPWKKCVAAKVLFRNTAWQYALREDYMLKSEHFFSREVRDDKLHLTTDPQIHRKSCKFSW